MNVNEYTQYNYYRCCQCYSLNSSLPVFFSLPFVHCGEGFIVTLNGTEYISVSGFPFILIGSKQSFYISECCINQKPQS